MRLRATLQAVHGVWACADTYTVIPHHSISSWAATAEQVSTTFGIGAILLKLAFIDRKSSYNQQFFKKNKLC